VKGLIAASSERSIVILVLTDVGHSVDHGEESEDEDD
jgi:hypothetical protein